MKTRRSGRNKINENQKITLTLGQLRRLVNEDTDKDNFHFNKQYVVVSCHADTYPRGLSGKNNLHSTWDEELVPLKKNYFNSVEDALREVCAENGYGYNESKWKYDVNKDQFVYKTTLNSDLDEEEPILYKDGGILRDEYFNEDYFDLFIYVTIKKTDLVDLDDYDIDFFPTTF